MKTTKLIKQVPTEIPKKMLEFLFTNFVYEKIKKLKKSRLKITRKATK